MARRFERVTVQGHGQARKRLLLRVTAETQPTKIFPAGCLVGVEVDREGDEIAARGSDERRHVIDKIAILRRQPMVFSRTYGWLVPA